MTTLGRSAAECGESLHGAKACARRRAGRKGSHLRIVALTCATCVPDARGGARESYVEVRRQAQGNSEFPAYSRSFYSSCRRSSIRRGPQGPLGIGGRG